MRLSHTKKLYHLERVFAIAKCNIAHATVFYITIIIVFLLVFGSKRPPRTKTLIFNVDLIFAKYYTVKEGYTMKILLVEDEKELSRALAKMLAKDGYEVDQVYDGADGLNYGSTGMYDVILLDVIMPKMNGFEVLAALRSKKISTPIIMLTALTSEGDKIAGLDKGADDYVPKPFSYGELSARIRAVLRRQGKLVSDNKLEYEDASLDLTSFVLRSPKGEIRLSQKEFELLRYLFEYPNFVAAKDDLILKAWGLDSEFESNNLEVYMSFLRKKLYHLGLSFTIESVRGVGYRLAPLKD